LRAVPTGLFLLAKTPGLKRFLVPPFLFTLAIYALLFWWTWEGLNALREVARAAGMHLVLPLDPQALRQGSVHAVANALPDHGIGLCRAAGEAPDTPSFDARSTALSAGSLAILEQLGLQDAVLDNAAGIDTVHVSRRGRLGLARLTAEEQNLPRLGAVVENRWFGHVLLRAVEADPAITLRAPASLTGIRRATDGYEATLDDGEELHTPLLIAADGARSRTRDWLGISARHRDIGHDALIANVGLVEPHRGQAFERFLDEGPLALLPLPGERMALVWTGPRDDVDRWMALDDNAFLAAQSVRSRQGIWLLDHR
jgi:2-polyprenyl-6-methoxyphenol hydroxylase-like FAD-dependent oxidoreductase